MSPLYVSTIPAAVRWQKRWAKSSAPILLKAILPVQKPSPGSNQDAVRLMKQVHGIDMEKDQYSKLLSELPEIDIVITMGCNVQCPFLPCSHREDWGLEDPSGKEDEVFLYTMERIQEKVLDLKWRIQEEKL